MADDFDRGVRCWRASVVPDINGEDIFKFLSRVEVAKLTSWIENACFAAQMALFTDTVTGACRKPSRIHDIPAAGLLQVHGAITVASIARNSLFRERWSVISIQRSRDGPRMAPVALQALNCNRA